MPELYAIILIVAVLGAAAFWQRARLLRLFGAGRRRDGDPSTLAGKADALALFQKTLDDEVARVHQAKKALDECRELLKSVQRQVESGEREKTRLESRIQAALGQGDPDHAAQEYAIQLAEVERQLTLLRAQLAEHKETYGRFAKQVEIGQKRLVETRRKAEQLGIALELSQREKELAQLAAASSSDDLGSRAASAEEQVQQEIDRRRAAGRVAVDLAGEGPSQAAEEEDSRKAEAATILERFKKPSTP